MADDFGPQSASAAASRAALSKSDAAARHATAIVAPRPNAAARPSAHFATNMASICRGRREAK
jgi:hypothetical protein